MIMLRGEGGKENQSFLFPQREALPSTAVKGSESSRRSGTENRVYLAFRVAAPGVDVPRGGQGQRVLGAHGDVLDEDPGQQWHLLRPVVVAGTALGQPNQAICKDKHQAPEASSTRGVSLQAQAGEEQTAVLYSPGVGTQGILQGQRAQIFPANHGCLQCLFTLLELLCPWSV